MKKQLYCKQIPAEPLVQAIVKDRTRHRKPAQRYTNESHLTQRSQRNSGKTQRQNRRLVNSAAKPVTENYESDCANPNTTVLGTEGDCGSHSLGEVGSSVLEKVKAMVNIMSDGEWEGLKEKAATLGRSEMFEHRRRTAAALSHLMADDDEQTRLIEFVRQKSGLGLPAINLMELIVSQLVVHGQIKLNVYPEELDRQAAKAMQDLIASMTTSCDEEGITEKVQEATPCTPVIDLPKTLSHSVKRKRHVTFADDDPLASKDKSPESSKPSPIGGLQNKPGQNLCFANSLLQCFRLTEIHRVLLLHTFCGQNDCFVCSLKTFVEDGPISAERLFGNSKGFWPGYKRGQQQDAHEFLQQMMGMVQEKCFPIDLPPTTRAESISQKEQNLFYGVQESSLSCLECGNKSSTFELFTDISLPINKTDSLQVSLAKYFSADQVEFQCSSCKNGKKANKISRLLSIPKTVIIQLKRFTGCLRKNCSKLALPVEIELGDFVGTDSKYQEHKATLFGVVVHSGKTCKSGHYYAFVQFGVKWYKMDDMKVTLVAVEDVLNCETDQPYILFYNRISTNELCMPIS